ncbi:MAG TPA: DUF3995 domain-containing protein [Candidatus Binatia bacterium]|jgi:hypothetical protein|nr:DUF3995 domain-containing protein [Candidatus Binatia bacterium]
MIAGLLAVVLGMLSLFHVAWACGARIGSNVVIPEVDGRPVFTPSRTATILVAVGLAGAAVVALARGGLIILPIPSFMVQLAAALLGLVFLARTVGDFRLAGAFKRIRGTPFATWDTWLFTPLCGLMSAGFFLIAS